MFTVKIIALFTHKSFCFILGYALAKVTQIVIYSFNITANLLLCCGIYIAKGVVSVF
jgi:uncharacterized membrane protein